MLHGLEETVEKFGGSYILNHARRTLHLCRLLSDRERLTYCEDILIFCCYMHDISAFPPYKPEGTFDHALESSKLMPELAKDYGFGEKDIDVIVDAVKSHNKADAGTFNESVLLRNADGVDYLGCMAIARDFSKAHTDMRAAVSALKSRKKQFYEIIDLPYAIELAEPRLKELEGFIRAFEEESFGLY